MVKAQIAGLEKIKTDADVAVYLRNTMRALAALSQETGIAIIAYASPDGYANARFGDYEYVEYGGEDAGEKYQYAPVADDPTRESMTDKWREVTPQEIRLGQPPKESEVRDP